ncbi:MAG TPA: ABC transporter ATP-binding protein [Candidatus Competibacteraceae bacterium]|nr:ABC transporter ATP-binding protein [Candidatus Competibacteraceae bacterium]
MSVLLSVQNLTKRFGGLVANNDISFDLKRGEILSVIGPNGAGKSTLFKLIGGFIKPTAGKVIFEGEDITGLPPHVIAERGIVRTFQETTIFKEMTALQNVVVAHHLQCHATTWGIFFNSRRAREDEARFRDNAAEILEFLGLSKVLDEPAGSLPHGYLRALGIAMGMAANPTVLLLDEPYAGMNPEETDQAVELTRKLVQRGITVILVEHDMRAVMRISDRIVVICFGSKIAEGRPEEIQSNETVIEAYLGREDAALGV